MRDVSVRWNMVYLVLIYHSWSARIPWGTFCCSNLRQSWWQKDADHRRESLDLPGRPCVSPAPGSPLWWCWVSSRRFPRVCRELCGQLTHHRRISSLTWWRAAPPPSPCWPQSGPRTPSHWDGWSDPSRPGAGPPWGPSPGSQSPPQWHDRWCRGLTFSFCLQTGWENMRTWDCPPTEAFAASRTWHAPSSRPRAAGIFSLDGKSVLVLSNDPLTFSL